MSAHAPTPWKIVSPGPYWKEVPWNVHAVSGDIVANTHYGDSAEGGKAHANAEFIVRACNSHDDLLEALEAFTNTFESAKPFELLADLSKAYEKARAALKKAKP